ncbi:MAG: rhomboid family intramembrane serine protease [Flavobacteriaceae bacterium]|nr:rhomboid family intramembrane serine protease [Flavobacteriaceae bacterium]
MITTDGIDMLGSNFTYWWQQRGIHEKLALSCVAFYLFQTLLPFLFDFSAANFLYWFSLPSSFWGILEKPWTLVSYAFFHASFSHLFFNIIMLYFGGQLFLNLFNAKRFLNVYFLGLITGGLVFLLSYTIFPVFSGNGASLIGASAGVTAIFIFICTYMPYQEVRVLFFNVKLWQLGVFFILTDLIQIPNGNAGGHLAHIGGGILGFVYANKLKEGQDIGRFFDSVLSSLSKLFTRTKSPLKTAYKNNKSASSQGVTTAYKVREQQKKIDAILDKISHSGYDSLTKEEKDYLFSSGKS